MPRVPQGAEEDIDERLDASVKRILQQNRRMAEELRLHIQETDELQAEMRATEDERIKLQRELNLKMEIEEQYAKRGAKQAKEIKDGQQKVIQRPSNQHYPWRHMIGSLSSIPQRAPLRYGC